MQRHRKSQCGFTLIEMIVVMVITGILGSIIAIFISGPVQGYLDSARRAEMSDIADTAMSRITRDLRTALPNSVRVTNQSGGACNGTTDICYLEFIPTTGGGRYRSAQDCSSTCTGNALVFSPLVASSFDVLGAMPTFVAGYWVVVNNIGTTSTNTGSNATGANVYDVPPTNRAIVSIPVTTPTVTFVPPFTFPTASPEARFQVISTPVSYVCNPAAGTLTRYAGYPIAATQPTSTLAGGNVLASNVSACKFANPVAGLVTVNLTISESGESVSLYDAASVANVP